MRSQLRPEHSGREKTGPSLLVCTILHVLYADADQALAGVANFLSRRTPLGGTRGEER